MPESELDRAKKLLMRPDLEQQDRDALLTEYPELSPAEPLIAEPMTPTEDPSPAPVSMETDVLGARIGIQPTELGTEVLEPALVDDTYEALMARQQQQQLEDLDFQPDNPDIRNATKRMSMDPIPQINPDAAAIYYHFEPTLDEVKKWAAKTGNETAYKELEEKEEESDIYKKYADILWKKVKDAFQRTGEGAIRLEYMDPETASQWYYKLMGPLQGRAVSFLGGFDDTLSFGLGQQALASASGMMTTQAEKELEKSGVIRPFAERLAGMKQRYPVESTVGSVMGYINPGSAAKTVTKGVTKVAKEIGKTTAKWLAPFVEAGLGGLATGTVRKTGAELRGEEAPTASDVARETGAAALFGGLLGAGGETLARIGKGRATALRADPAMRENLARLEMGAPAERGGTTMTPFSGGIRPHKRYTEKAAEIAEESVAARRAGLPQPPPKAPTGELAESVEWDMRQELASFRATTEQQIEAMKEPYYRATENAKVSVEKVGKRIMEMMNESAPEKWDFPWTKNEMMEKALRGLRRKVVHMDGSETYRWRKLNPREFDTMTGLLDDMLNEEANKTATKTLPRQLSEIQYLLRETRDKFPANEYAPESLTETVMIGGQPTKIKGGLSALNARSHKMMNKVRNAAAAMNLKKVDRFEPDIASQKEAVIKRIKDWGLENKTVSDDVLRDLFKGRPDLVETLDAIASGEAFESFQRGIGQTGGISGGMLGSPRVLATSRLDRITGTYMDPMNMLLSKIEGKGGPAATVAGIRNEEIEFIPAAERALLGIKDVSGATIEGLGGLWELFNQYKSRGLMKETKTTKEKRQ